MKKTVLMKIHILLLLRIQLYHLFMRFSTNPSLLFVLIKVAKAFIALKTPHGMPFHPIFRIIEKCSKKPGLFP